MSDPTRLPEWQSLIEHHAAMGSRHMRELFAEDSGRFDRFQVQGAGLFLDYSKNRIQADTMSRLVALAHACELPAHRDALFSGAMANPTEQRAALHSALRASADAVIRVEGHNIVPDIQAVQRRIARFADELRNGQRRGHTGQRITDVVNIGIGGSDLGPLMATEALAPFVTPDICFHFVSNVDGSHLSMALKDLNPETTLFIVASKTFTTIETLTNARTARRWFLDSGADTQAIADHFVALSTNAEAVSEFGISLENMFEFWDFVGGRYSVWSAIGLSLVIAIGSERFEQFLEGAREMDQHFQNAALEDNMPVILALLTVWYCNFFGATSHLVSPYDQLLHRFPAYLQQLTMESNGKSVQLDGSAVSIMTEPVVWGEPGTNGQHAYFQLLHQGTHLIPVDFIVPIQSLNEREPHHELLLANCLAQSQALMLGKTEEEAFEEMTSKGMERSRAWELAPHRTFPGNRPSNTLLANRIDPRTLGAMIALYEHKVFVEAVIWNINPFDQWGVELGKQLASTLYEDIEAGRRVERYDSSTNGLLNRVVRRRTLIS